MKSMIRLTSVALIIVLFASCLFSCEMILGKNPTKVLEQADKALDSAPYTALMGIDYSSEDEKMAEAIEHLSTPAIKMCVDGGDFTAEMSHKLNGMDASYKYTVIGGMIYYDSCVEGTDSNTVIKQKAVYTESMRDGIISRFGAGANLRADDFENVAAVGMNGVVIVTCTDIKDAALMGVVDMLERDLSDIGATVAIKDASLTLQIEDGKYTVSLFVCSYVIATDTDVYELTLTHGTQFDYESQVKISIPENIDEYISAPLV